MSVHRKILAATDFSPEGNRAVAYAVHLAKLNRAKLVLMTVLDDLMATDQEMMMLRVSVASVKSYNQEKIDAAQKKLEKLVRPAEFKALKPELLVYDGKSAAEIIRAAQEVKADLIVLASHGRHHLAEVLLGSTTDRVINRAPCSVLVIREKANALKIP